MSDAHQADEAAQAARDNTEPTHEVPGQPGVQPQYREVVVMKRTRHPRLVRMAVLCAVGFVGLLGVQHLADTGHLGPNHTPPATVQAPAPIQPPAAIDPTASPSPPTAAEKLSCAGNAGPVWAGCPSVEIQVTPHYQAAQPGLPATVILDLKFINRSTATATAPIFQIATKDGPVAMSGTLIASVASDGKTAAIADIAPGESRTDFVSVKAAQMGGEFWVNLLANGKLANSLAPTHFACAPVAGLGVNCERSLPGG